MLLKAIYSLSNLQSLHEEGYALTKREVLGSIFREKLRFDGNEYRTPDLTKLRNLSIRSARSCVQIKTGKKLIFQLFPV